MLQNPNFSDPTGGAYSALPDPLTDRERALCPTARNSTLALGPSGLVSTGLKV